MHRGFIFIVLIIISILPNAVAQKQPLRFEDMFSMERISDAQISPDGRWIAYQLTSYDIGANKGNHDIFLISSDGKQHKQITTHPKTDAAPRWSPDGRELAFISTRDGLRQIYVIDVRGGEARSATALPTGINSFSWSPDGKAFLATTDVYPDVESPQASARMAAAREADAASGRVIDHLLFRHWNAWREGKFSHLVRIDRQSGETIDLTPGAYDCPPISLGSSHDYAASPDGKQVCYVQNRDAMVAASTNNDLWLIDATGSKARQVTTRKGNDNGPRFSPDGKSIAYLSMARPGFEADQQDLMIYDIASGKIRNLTADLDRSVSDIAWSPASDRLYFYVPHHGRHRLYEVALRSGKRRLLLDRHYLGGMAVSPNGKFLVLQHQRANMPYELFRFDLKSARMTRLTYTNRQRLADLEMPTLEDHWFTGAKGDSVHLLMLKPPQFDAGRKYPLISLIHGGPQGAWGDDFHYRWNSQMFAAPGYVVIMINFHGSRGYGQAFCDAVSRDWGGAPFEDVMTGTRWAINQFSFIDGERVGAAGASYGGFMINWIEGHNEDGLFKTLVSHDGVFEQVSMFGATEELWFPMWEFNGTPWSEGSLYHKWNPVNHVDNFNTPMLVIHGEHDYRVPYTQGLQLFTALQMKGVPSRLLFYPDEDHFVRKPQNARLWWRTVHDWLADTLRP